MVVEVRVVVVVRVVVRVVEVDVVGRVVDVLVVVVVVVVGVRHTPYHAHGTVQLELVRNAAQGSWAAVEAEGAAVGQTGQEPPILSWNVAQRGQGRQVRAVEQ